MTSTTIPTRVSATQIRGRRGLDLRRWASTALVAALAGAGLLGLPQPAGAEILPATTNLVVNGGFEEPDVATGSAGHLSSIPGWSLAPGGCGFEVQDHALGLPFEGTQHAELDSYCSTGIFQDLATEAGQSYTITYAFSPRPDHADNVLVVSWDGIVIATHTASGVGMTNTSWTVYTQTVLATSPTSRLTFSDGGVSDTHGTYLDAVSVPVSSPTTADPCKKGGWQLLVDSRGVSFKNQGDCVSFFATKNRNLAAG
jgi:hypothetical protein